MADTDIGNLKVGVGLDTAELEKGVAKAEKSLNQLDSKFLKSQQNISGAIRNLSSAMNANSKAINDFTTKTTRAIRNQAIYLKKSLESVEKSIKKNTDATITASNSTVLAINKMGMQLMALYALSQKDFTKGMRELAKEIRRDTLQSVSDLKKIQAQANATNNSLGKLSKVKGLNSGLISLGTNTFDMSKVGVPKTTIATDLKTATVNADGLTSSLMNTWHTLSMISFQVYLFQQGLQQVSNLISTFVAPGWEFAKAMETNEVGMAGILSSMTRLNDKELEWNDALGISRSIIKDLNYEAVRTAATSEELVGTFRALLAPGLGAGFSLDEVKKFTVIGVNAVKSMGLEGRQLVQELRDLVQGGIQPASSTLATSLGLTDKDIKEAKESSEGLFAFLMKKLAGFKYSAEATSQTIKGLESIVTEGYVMASAEALQPIMNEYQKILISIKDQMFDEQSFTLKPEFVDGFRQVSEYSLMLLNNVADVAKALMPVGELAMDVLVPALKLGARYSDLIVASWMSLVIADKIKGLGNIETELGNISRKQLDVSEATKQATQRYNDSMQSALTAGQKLIASHNAEKQAQNTRRDTAKNITKLLVSGNDELAKSVHNLYPTYRKLGLSSQEASRLQNEASKLAVAGNEELYHSMVQVTTARLNDAKQSFKDIARIHQEADARQRLIEKCTLLASRLQGVGIALSGAGMLVKMFTDEENETVQKTADLAIQAGIVVSTFSNLIEVLPNLKDGFSSISTAIGKLILALGNLSKFGTLLQILGSAGIGAGIGAGVGALTVGAYAMANNLSKEEVQRRWDDAWDNGAERQVRINQGVAKNAQGLDNAYNELLLAEKAKKLTVAPENVEKSDLEKGHIRSEYKRLEQELKTALTDLKETQKAFDHYYKYDLTSTQNYVSSKYALERQAIDVEIANLEQRKKVAQEMQQFADVANFNTQIERLGKERANLDSAEVRELADEYKKLDDRLYDIKKEFEGLVGVSEKAFEENLVRDYSASIVRVSRELETASKLLDEATKDNNASEMELWATRKKSYQEAQERLQKIISLKKLEFDATQALANAEKINLEIEDKFIAIQREAENGNISSLNAESQLYEMKKEHLDEYIELYTTAIARYEQMAQVALKSGDISGFNDFKQKAIEAKQALDEVANAIHPLQKVIKEEFADSLSEAFQSMLWGEKTAKEALKDFANSIMQTFTKQVFDNFSKQIASAIFPQGNFDIETAVQSKVNVDLTAFNQNITQGAQTFQEGLVYSVTRLNEFNNALYQATQAILTQQAGSQGGSTNKWGQMANLAINASGIVNGGGEGSSSLAGVGQALSGLSFAIGGMNLSENQLGGLGDLSDDASDASISLSSLTKSLGSSTSATDDNAKATGSNVLAIGTMITSLLSASGSLGKFGTVLQGLMMAMQIAKATGILGFAEGGYIQGSGTGTSDSIPARLSNGEYVLRAGAVKQLGVGFLDQLNNIDRSGVRRSSRLPKFAYAEGGYVSAESNGETKSSTPQVTGGVAQPTVVMQMTFQSLDPKANMELMEAQYPQIRSRLIRDLQNNSSMRTAVKGATK